MHVTLSIFLGCLLMAGSALAWEAKPAERKTSIVIGGDMLFPQGQGRSKRELFDPAATRFWPSNTIPYALSNANAETRQVFLEAIEEIHAKTHVRFVPRDREIDYVEVESVSGPLCRAMTGQTGGGQLFQISEDPDCRSKGGILHELMHSLGFLHEHNRPDRDRYIEIRWKNLPESIWSEFAAEHQSLAQDSYDYDSVTHYAATVMSKNGRPTIVPRDPTIAPTRLGNQQNLSPGDVRMINRAYPAERQLVAQNNGLCATAHQGKQPSLRLEPCDATQRAQFWRYKPGDGIISNAAHAGFCLSKAKRHPLRVVTRRCDDNRRARWAQQGGALINVHPGPSGKTLALTHDANGDILLAPISTHDPNQNWAWRDPSTIP